MRGKKMKQMVKKYYWILSLGIGALLLGEHLGEGGMFAGGIGLILVFAYKIIKGLNNKGFV